MREQRSRRGLRDFVRSLGILCAAAALLSWPQSCMEAVREGMRLWGTVLVPALFPFFVLSSLTVELGLTQYPGKLLEPVMSPLFRVNGACAGALVLGWIGGYPVGARTAAALYRSGQCSRTEAERLLAFCNNSGPAFILGAVGTGIFGDGRVGLLLCLTHILASILVGVLFRFYGTDCGAKGERTGWTIQTADFAPALIHCVTGAMRSLMNICAFVLFFSVFIRTLKCSGLISVLAVGLEALLRPFGWSGTGTEALITGFFELSSGAACLNGAGPGEIALAAFLLGWGGLSVHCQVLELLGDSGLSVRPYILGKLLHAGLSALLAGAGARLLPAGVLGCTAAAGAMDSGMSCSLPDGAGVCLAGLWLLFLVLGVGIIICSTEKMG